MKKSILRPENKFEPNLNMDIKNVKILHKKVQLYDTWEHKNPDMEW